jgi:methylated-DNA-[protein]-cysteine S-methyltransferase
MSATVYARHPSPLGELLLVGEDDAQGTVLLTGCYLPGQRHGRAVEPGWREDPAALAAVAAALDAHLAGDAGATTGLPIAFRSGTPFQRGTWAALRTIPAGTTTTYGALAAHLGRIGAARAIGAAVARNPISIVVPCHRVVGSDGSLRGYAGGLPAKLRLLEIEGAGSGAGGAG